MTRLCITLFSVALLAGCSHVDQSPSLTETDTRLASKEYWIDQPGNASVAHDDFDQLWNAAVGAARWRGYRPERIEYRNGIFQTYPVVSKQIFEPWRRDVSSMESMTESTLATMRRIVRFEISKRDDDTFECVPKVIVQRYSSLERRVTSITRYRETFSIASAVGNKERDRGVDLVDTYWYAVGRDADMEKELAKAVESRVKEAVASR
jgi:hypothetical protein